MGGPPTARSFPFGFCILPPAGPVGMDARDHQDDPKRHRSDPSERDEPLLPAIAIAEDEHEAEGEQNPKPEEGHHGPSEEAKQRVNRKAHAPAIPSTRIALGTQCALALPFALNKSTSWRGRQMFRRATVRGRRIAAGIDASAGG